MRFKSCTYPYSLSALDPLLLLLKFPSTISLEIDACSGTWTPSSPDLVTVLIWVLGTTQAERKKLCRAVWVLNAEAVHGWMAGPGWADLGGTWTGLDNTEACWVALPPSDLGSRSIRAEISGLSEDPVAFGVQCFEVQSSVPGCWPALYAPECRAAEHSQHLVDKVSNGQAVF